MRSGLLWWCRRLRRRRQALARGRGRRMRRPRAARQQAASPRVLRCTVVYSTFGLFCCLQDPPSPCSLWTVSHLQQFHPVALSPSATMLCVLLFPCTSSALALRSPVCCCLPCQPLLFNSWQLFSARSRQTVWYTATCTCIYSSTAHFECAH